MCVRVYMVLACVCVCVCVCVRGEQCSLLRVTLAENDI